MSKSHIMYDDLFCLFVCFFTVLTIVFWQKAGTILTDVQFTTSFFYTFILFDLIDNEVLNILIVCFQENVSVSMAT